MSFSILYRCQMCSSWNWLGRHGGNVINNILCCFVLQYSIVWAFIVATARNMMKSLVCTCINTVRPPETLLQTACCGPRIPTLKKLEEPEPWNQQISTAFNKNSTKPVHFCHKKTSSKPRGTSSRVRPFPRKSNSWMVLSSCNKPWWKNAAVGSWLNNFQWL